MISNQKQKIFNPNSVHYQNRHFNQDTFHILVPHDATTKPKTYQVHQFKRTKHLEMVDLVKTNKKKTLFSEGVLYFLDSDLIKSYSLTARKLKVLYKHSIMYLNFNACMFMGNIYMLGIDGKLCVFVDPKTSRLKKIADRTGVQLVRSLQTELLFLGVLILIRAI